MTTNSVNVPRVPTQEMVQVGYETMRKNNVIDTSEQGRIRRIYAAMIDTAPHPAEAQAPVVDDELVSELDKYLDGCPNPDNVSPKWLLTKSARLLWRCRAALTQRGDSASDKKSK
jgi:hypothetical protein